MLLCCGERGQPSVAMHYKGKYAKLITSFNISSFVTELGKFHRLYRSAKVKTKCEVSFHAFEQLLAKFALTAIITVTAAAATFLRVAACNTTVDVYINYGL
jgi:hypothetical protein